MDITKDKQLIGQEITLTKANSKTRKITNQDIANEIKLLRREINERLDYIVRANNLKDIGSK
jgi:predicted HTH transcriptional regulator